MTISDGTRRPQRWIPSIPGLAVIYWVAAAAWIVGSDLLLGALRGELTRTVFADIAKGLLFVTVTAVLLAVVLVRRERMLDDERSRVSALESHLHETQRMDAVGRLARGTAHDVNNLLAVIRGHVDLARLDAPTEQLESLDAIDAALDRAVELTRELQTVAGRQNLDLEPTDLSRYLADRHSTLRALLPDTVELHVNRPSSPVHVLLDPGRFDQVLLNLATNAADAMPDGGRIDLALRTDGDDAVLEMCDTGHGMSDEIIRHCFEPFFSTKTTGGRSGMGLSIAYGVVRQTGGRIHVESAPGSGSTFAVALPLTRSPNGSGESD